MKKALLIVDVQNDFCPGGALAVPDGDRVIEPLNRMVEHAQTNGWLIIASRDWHPEQTSHFNFWPIHCVRNTRGAEFHPSLRIPRIAVIISKGIGNKDDGYSLFEGLYIRTADWSLSPEVFLRICNKIYIGGLATDYCVKATALDAVKKGFKTYLLFDACRAVNINPGDEGGALEEMNDAGVIITTTQEVLNA